MANATSSTSSRVKKAKECLSTEAEVDVGQIDLFGAFSQSSHGIGDNAPSPPLRCKRRRSSNRGHEVDNDDDEDDNEDSSGGGYGGCGGGRGKGKRGY